MEWEILLIDVVVGGVAGGLGALLTRKRPPSKKSTTNIIVAALAIGGITVANQAIMPRVRAARAHGEIARVGQQLFGSEQAADLYAASLAPMLSEPKFRERMAAINKTPAGASTSVDGAAMTATARLVSAGMARLTDAEQETFADLKAAMATHSVELCAGFWTGRLRMEDMSAALHLLTEEQKAAWIRISMEALKREVHATAPAAVPSENANTDALKALQTGLTPDEKVVFERTLQAGQSATSKDACASFQMVLVRGKAQPAAVRATLVRMMVVAPDAG
jgi:hypothetical protein